MKYKLRITAEQHDKLRAHLFPGDDLEAAALLLCGRNQLGDRHVLSMHKSVMIPHNECQRAKDRVTWPTHFADKVIAEAAKQQMAVVKVHSHPTGFPTFSATDDLSDRSFFRSVCTNLEDKLPHASLVMLPDGRIFGRTICFEGDFHPIDLVSVCGEDLQLWYSSDGGGVPSFALRHAQVFGDGTVQILRKMRIAVIGCSGTGSPLIEQLVRLGVGNLVLVDPDGVEWKNLNRIFMSTAGDANLNRKKVNVIAESIGRIGLATEVEPIALELSSPEVVKAVASCDAVFGCMDSVAGRDLLNRLATFYLLPYFDLGVQITALPSGGVDQITGAVHYLQPGKSSLKSRGVYDSEDVRAELLKRDDPAEYNRQLKEKYIQGVQVDRPAVISVNTLVASMAANELLARIHSFRYDRNDSYGSLRFAVHEPGVFREAESELPQCSILKKYLGRGDLNPLLNRPELSLKTP